MQLKKPTNRICTVSYRLKSGTCSVVDSAHIQDFYGNLYLANDGYEMRNNGISKSNYKRYILTKVIDQDRLLKSYLNSFHTKSHAWETILLQFITISSTKLANLEEPILIKASAVIKWNRKVRDLLSGLPSSHPFPLSFEKYHDLFKSENFALIEKIKHAKSFLDTAMKELRDDGYLEQVHILLDEEFSKYSSCKSRWMDRELRQLILSGESIFIREFRVTRYLQLWWEQILYAFDKYYDTLQEVKDLIDSAAIRSSSIMSALKSVGEEHPKILNQEILEGFASIIDLNGFAQRADLFLPRISDLHTDLAEYLKSKLEKLPETDLTKRPRVPSSPFAKSPTQPTSISSMASEPHSPASPFPAQTQVIKTSRGSIVLPPPPPPPPRPPLKLAPTATTTSTNTHDEDPLLELIADFVDRKHSAFESNGSAIETPNYLKASFDSSAPPTRQRLPTLTDALPAAPKPPPKQPFALSIRTLVQHLDVNLPKWTLFANHTVSCQMVGGDSSPAFLVLDVR